MRCCNWFYSEGCTGENQIFHLYRCGNTPGILPSKEIQLIYIEYWNKTNKYINNIFLQLFHCLAKNTNILRNSSSFLNSLKINIHDMRTFLMKVHRSLTRNGLHPYHLTPQHHLLLRDFQSRVDYWNWLIAKCLEDPTFKSRILYF